MLASTIAAMALAATPVADDTVVCLENTTDETMVAFVAEKYLVGAKKVRQVALEAGKKSCLRYDAARTVTITPLMLSEAQRRIARGDRVNPWRKGSCGRVGKGEAVFLSLSGNDGEDGACTAAGDRADGDIRALVAEAAPLQP